MPPNPLPTADELTAKMPRGPGAVSPGAHVGQIVTLYHHSPGEEPTAADVRSGRWVGSEEQPYSRPLCRAGTDWAPLDLGWLAGRPVSRVLIENREGKFLQVNPTPDERAAAEARVIEVAVQAHVDSDPPRVVVLPFALVRPGECLPFEPVDPAALRVRCAAGPAKFSLLVVPG
jgi:hypothetical protein